jgi:hypothetical protein
MEAMPLKVKPRRVIVTAYGREEVFHEAEGAGLDSVPVKPVSPSLLFDTAIRALAGDAPAMAAPAAIASPEPTGDPATSSSPVCRGWRARPCGTRASPRLSSRSHRGAVWDYLLAVVRPLAVACTCRRAPT